MPKHITSVLDLQKDELLEIFEIADNYINLVSENKHILDGKILGTFFLQPSTRTQLSFQSSFLRLGGKWIGFSDIETTRMGDSYHESFEDTAKVVTEYCDIIVLRSPDDTILNTFKANATVPIISAGCGTTAHPTQGLLDLYTIYNLLQKLDALNILICGNLDNRCINSFLAGLSFWENINIYFIAPEELRHLHNQETLSPNFENIYYYKNYDEFFEASSAKSIDVIYIDDINIKGQSMAQAYEAYPDLMFTGRKLEEFNEDVIILHSLPRSGIALEIDNYPNAKYFQQSKNGLRIRTALFYWLFTKNFF